jgi:hypothetical protein
VGFWPLGWEQYSDGPNHDGDNDTLTHQTCSVTFQKNKEEYSKCQNCSCSGAESWNKVSNTILDLHFSDLLVKGVSQE